ncbi:ABC transporter transmembrane region domain-containing protein [Toxoplasma gondii p89]|uniref:ABC transporter transmembrane region domain-containing protein n=1 Tax=Toxoplasma gondii p89 TaxID=943119 RepID=A0A086JAT9_TOXGO|nr:ABC transporter transmembrane region domain-containing protein [Toxoplasma gondii p89]
MPGVLSKGASSPEAPATSRASLFALFSRFCPDRTRKRLFLAFSSLIVCSSCNLATPTLLGIAIDAASSSSRSSSLSSSLSSSFSASAGAGCAPATGLFAGVGSVLSGVWTVLGQVLCGGGKEALKSQPPKVLFTLIACVVCLGAFSSFLRTSQLETAEHEMRMEVRRQLFRTLLYMPPSLFLCRSPGHLLPLFTEDTEALVSALTQTQAQALRYTSSVVGGSSLLLLISPRVTVLALLLLPLAGCSAMLLAKRLRRLRSIREKEMQECTAFLSDRLFHVKTVYIHQEQEQELFRLQKRQDEALEAAKAAAVANGCFFGGLSFSINATVLALLTYGTTLVKQGVLSYGNLTTFAVYSSMVGVGFSGLTAVSSELARAAEAGARLHAVLSVGETLRLPGTSRQRELPDAREQRKHKKQKREGQEEEQRKEREEEGKSERESLPLLVKISEFEEGRVGPEDVAQQVEGKIVFSNVSFSYGRSKDFQERSAPTSSLASLLLPAHASEAKNEGREIGESQETPETTGDTAALKNVSLVFPPGSVTAVTGASGAGKSTLLKLLTQELRPQQGTVTLDGVDVQAIPTRLLLQKLIGVVNNESTSLLTGLSVRENITYGVWTPPATPEPAAGSPELFLEVCRLCKVDKFLSAPNLSRENEVVEGAAAGFSSGEQQRLGLARALIKRASVLVLDEATAHLDAENERLLLQTLRELLQKENSTLSTGESERNETRLLTGAVKTVVLIAHSKAALQMADSVVVLRAGEIVEQGSFETLVKANGELARLLKLQEQSGDTSERTAPNHAEK